MFVFLHALRCIALPAEVMNVRVHKLHLNSGGRRGSGGGFDNNAVISSAENEIAITKYSLMQHRCVSFQNDKTDVESRISQ